MLQEMRQADPVGGIVHGPGAHRQCDAQAVRAAHGRGDDAQTVSQRMERWFAVQCTSGHDGSVRFLKVSLRTCFFRVFKGVVVVYTSSHDSRGAVSGPGSRGTVS